MIRLFLLQALALMAAQAAGPVLTKAENKQFTFTQTYETFVRYYKQPAYVELPGAPLPEAQMKAENVLAEQERAEYTGDFDAWLNTFNEPSQQKWKDRLSAQGITKEKWEAARKGKAPKPPRLGLISWVARQNYILIEYDLIPDRGAVQRKVGVFRLNGKGLWKAWLDLEQDGVYRALSVGKTEVIEDLPR